MGFDWIRINNLIKEYEDEFTNNHLNQPTISNTYYFGIYAWFNNAIHVFRPFFQEGGQVFLGCHSGIGDKRIHASLIDQQDMIQEKINSISIRYNIKTDPIKIKKLDSLGLVITQFEPNAVIAHMYTVQVDYQSFSRSLQIVKKNQLTTPLLLSCLVDITLKEHKNYLTDENIVKHPLSDSIYSAAFQLK